RADGGAGEGGGRVHGNRHATGRVVGPAAAPVQLFRAAVRAGNEPADRSDPGVAGDVAVEPAGAPSEPVRGDTGARAATASRPADSDGIRVREAPVDFGGSVQNKDVIDAIRRRRGSGRNGPGAGAAL